MGHPETPRKSGTSGPQRSARLCSWRRDEFPLEPHACLRLSRWNYHRRGRTLYTDLRPNSGHTASDAKPILDRLAYQKELSDIRAGISKESNQTRSLVCRPRRNAIWMFPRLITGSDRNRFRIFRSPGCQQQTPSVFPV